VFSFGRWLHYTVYTVHCRSLRHFERFCLLVIGTAMIIQVSTAKLRKKKDKC
jgi:hypothetical protein